LRAAQPFPAAAVKGSLSQSIARSSSVIGVVLLQPLQLPDIVNILRTVSGAFHG
jgi:hypothetical protein